MLGTPVDPPSHRTHREEKLIAIKDYIAESEIFHLGSMIGGLGWLVVRNVLPQSIINWSHLDCYFNIRAHKCESDCHYFREAKAREENASRARFFSNNQLTALGSLIHGIPIDIQVRLPAKACNTAQYQAVELSNLITRYATLDRDLHDEEFTQMVQLKNKVTVFAARHPNGSYPYTTADFGLVSRIGDKVVNELPYLRQP